MDAVDELCKEGLNPKFHQLDIDDTASIERLYNFLKVNYGGLDVLVNNAGIAYKVNLAVTGFSTLVISLIPIT